MKFLKNKSLVNIKKRTPVLYITRAAIIAAMYAAVTYAVQPIAFSAVQFRLSEVLTVLPFLIPEAIPGLFIGCVVSNLLSPHFVILDVVIGGGATLLAAYLSYRCKNKWLVPLPPVLLNALGVGFVISISSSGTESFWLLYGWNFITVGISQAVICYGLGLPFLLLMERVFTSRTGAQTSL